VWIAEQSSVQIGLHHKIGICWSASYYLCPHHVVVGNGVGTESSVLLHDLQLCRAESKGNCPLESAGF
jgi:hypothetical protein